MQKFLPEQSNKFIMPGNKDDYFEPKDIRRRWEVNYSYKRNVYLTDEERLYFITKISEGVRIVQVGELTLTNNFKTIVPIRTKAEVEEYLLKKSEPKPWE